MSQTIKKSVLCDLVSRHSDFNYERYVANTPLDEFDIWNGYCLPMHYTNVGDEYAAIRHSCALFDASPMKKYRFRGADAGPFLDRILTAPVSQLPAMKSAYGLICNEEGLLLDDGIVNKYEEDNPKSKYEIESPSHSVDFDEKQHCRVRITTASADRDETALYAVIFNQSPRTVHFFRQDERSNRGKFVSSQDFSNSLRSSIKNIERRTKKTRVYYRDGYYGDKTRLELNYDAIRIRPRSGKQRYIIYNPSGYTNANMDGAYLSIIEEYKR